MNQLALCTNWYICYKETLCVPTFISKNKNVIFFSFFLYKIGEQEGGTGPAWGRCVCVCESEYGANTVHTLM
jgi:hypothetical protein